MTAVFAHRGAHTDVRENTLEAFRRAAELGVAGVELDVRRSRDGVLVVHHDAHVAFLAIDETPAHDLPAYVPRLEEALAACEGLVVNVEIKNAPEEPSYDASGSLVRDVLACVRESGREVIISCFDLATCDEVRRLDEALEVAWLVYGGVLEDDVDTARSHGLFGLNPYVSMVKASGRARAADLGVALNVWTVNERRDLVTLGALAVESVITDEPALALEVLAE